MSNVLRCSYVGCMLLLLLSCFSCVRLCVTPEIAAHQAPPSLGFSRQEHWIGLPFPSPMHESEKWKWSRSVVSNSSRPHGLQPTRLLRPWDFPGKNTGVGCHCLLRVGCIDIYNCYVFLLDWSLDHYVVSFLISCNLFYFKVYFFYYKDSFPLLCICMEYIFPSSHFQSILCLKVWSGCLQTLYKQYIYGSCFCIRSASLCLLDRAFNPFTFKVIIDIYVSIAIFLIVWCWFFRSFFFSCISWLYKSI